MKDFRTTKTLNLLVPNQVIPIEHYLRQPQRLIQAITDPKRIEPLGQSVYRLSLRPLSFLGIRIEPTADLRVWTQSDGTLRLQSVACEVKVPGYLSYVNQSFSMALEGRLKPERQTGGSVPSSTALRGKAHLAVQVELPAPIKFMPDSVLDSAGRTFLNGILSTIQHRIERQLVEDYRAWAVATQNHSVAAGAGQLQGKTAQ
jgi:hypothetical protein